MDINQSSVDMQTYCLDPPSNDGCPFGTCPNPDVTGLGQQISLYATATVFSIALIYGIDTDSSLRAGWYAYLVNIYALLIAALVSILQTQLSHDDALFVLVASASPASIYIWGLSIVAIIKFKDPPGLIMKSVKTKGERLFLLTLTCGSVVLWIVMFFLAIFPPSRISFSQPDCYQRADFTILGFTGLYMASIAFSILWVLAAAFLRKATIKSADDRRGANANQASLMSWTHASFKTYNIPFCHSRRQRWAFLFILQLSFVPIGHSWIPSLPPVVFYGVGIILVSILVWPPRGVRSRIFNDLKREGIYSLLLTIYVAASITVIVLDISILPSPMDIVVFFYCAAIWWQRIADCAPRYTSRRSTIIKKSLMLCGLIGFYAINNFPFLAFSILFPRNTLWIMTWQMWAIADSWSAWVVTTWRPVLQSADILKMLLFIAGPIPLWIFSTVMSNPSDTSAITFGQILALATVVAPFTSLLVTCYEKRGAIWKSLCMREILDDAENLLPMSGYPSALGTQIDLPATSKEEKNDSSSSESTYTSSSSSRRNIPMRRRTGLQDDSDTIATFNPPQAPNLATTASPGLQKDPNAYPSVHSRSPLQETHPGSRQETLSGIPESDVTQAADDERSGKTLENSRSA